MTNLVLIPGLGSDAAVWSRTIDALGNDVTCSVGDTLQDDSLAGMARRVLAEAPPRFCLAGLSMGGMVALEIMRVAPSRVTGLAILDSTAFPDTPQDADQRRRTVAAVRAGVDLRAAGLASLAWLVHPDTGADIRTEIVEMGLRVGAETYARQIEAVLARGDQRPVLAAIDVPTVVVTGAEDAMIPMDCARAIQSGIRNAELRVIANCGHLPPIEKPKETADLLRDLLAAASALASDPAGRA